MNDLLLDVPQTFVPPLVQARAELAKLEAEYNRILNDAEEAGNEGELEHVDEWKALRMALFRAQRRVECLEERAIKQILNQSRS